MYGILAIYKVYIQLDCVGMASLLSTKFTYD